MCLLSTAIIHLREPIVPSVGAAIEPGLRVNRGIEAVSYVPADSTVAVRYDLDETTLGDIVRAIEDIGPLVAGVAQRRAVDSAHFANGR